jgi:hypothetical protein
VLRDGSIQRYDKNAAKLNESVTEDVFQNLALFEEIFLSQRYVGCRCERGKMVQKMCLCSSLDSKEKMIYEARGLSREKGVASAEPSLGAPLRYGNYR